MRAGACDVCCGGTCVGIRGQHLRVGSFLPLPGLWGCDSDYQACVASTSIHESSHQPSFNNSMFNLLL